MAPSALADGAFSFFKKLFLLCDLVTVNPSDSMYDNAIRR